jgi:hypothetical protein
MLSTAEQSVLAVFRAFHVGPGEMLCFHGPQLAKYGACLRGLAEKNLVVKEQFAGGYSLTSAGFDAMAAPRPKAPVPAAAAPKAATPKAAASKASAPRQSAAPARKPAPARKTASRR